MLVMLLVCFVMLSFMLEGEPHLKVVDEIKDSGKRRKFQVCSACVCVCACVHVWACGCSHWLCTHVQCESTSDTILNFGQAVQSHT